MKVKRKKLKLRSGVKRILIGLLVLVLADIFILGVRCIYLNYQRTARACDNYYGYKCSLKMVDDYARGLK